MTDHHPFVSEKARHEGNEFNDLGGWWARQDLNLGPMDYESTALTAVLRARPLLQFYSIAPTSIAPTTVVPRLPDDFLLTKSRSNSRSNSFER
jgi:hypothetical protein